MTAWERKNVLDLTVQPGRLLGWSLAAALLLTTAALAQDNGAVRDLQSPAQPVAQSTWPVYVVPGPPEISTLYYDGSQILVETEGRWSLISGSDPAGVTTKDLKTWAERHEALMKAGPEIIVGSPDRSRTNFNVVFHAGGSVPPVALPALAAGAAYLNSLFYDAITVDISITFEVMSDPNILGATLVNYNNSQTYTNSRAGLVNGMWCYDVIQSWLPLGDHCLVRYNGGSDVVSEQHTINWPKAAYKATMGTTGGYGGSTAFNSLVTWDYDPNDGIDSGAFSFMDVLIHETGHALGFVSAVDQGSTMHVMDLYRFQRTDGCCDYNPDTYEEFQVRPRLVDDNTPDDDHNTDFVIVEYRMSDGDPEQGSHWRSQYPKIGLMDPYISPGVTDSPNYYSSADIAMFDAIGYDDPPCVCPKFTQQPQDVTGCLGGTVQLSVAVNLANPGYQWYNGNDLLEESAHYVGATTATLHIVGLTLADVSESYYCLVTNLDDDCQHASDYATVGVRTPPTVTDPPDGKTVSEGDNVGFHVVATGEPPLSYHWRRNGQYLYNGGNIYGATTPNLAVLGVHAYQAGCYDVEVTNACGPVISTEAQLCVNTDYGAGRGDMDCDGVVGFGDINPFILALSGGETQYYNSYPDCHFYNADINCSGSVDFGDINPFVDCIIHSGCLTPPPCPQFP